MWRFLARKKAPQTLRSKTGTVAQQLNLAIVKAQLQAFSKTLYSIWGSEYSQL